MNRRKLRWLLLVCVLTLGVHPSETHAQVGIGFYSVQQCNLAGSHLTRTSRDSSSRVVASVVAPERDIHGTAYVEHWISYQPGPLLVPGVALEIRPESEQLAPGSAMFVSGGHGTVWDAWSEEESFESRVDVADLHPRLASAGLHVEIAEIIQCHDCTGDLGLGEMSAVGWMLEITDDEGQPVGQEWWLTSEYTYPSPLLTKRTYLRTLDGEERARQTWRRVVKRIAVDFRRAGTSNGVGGATEPALMGSRASDPDNAAGCARGGPGGIGSGGFAAAILGVFGAWRRRRSRRG